MGMVTRCHNYSKFRGGVNKVISEGGEPFKKEKEGENAFFTPL